MQWETVDGLHSLTRVRIPVDDESVPLPPYDKLDGLVDAAKQRFDSPNSFRFYYGDVRNMNLIASSDEWKDEASIFVDDCVDRRLSFTLLIEEVVKGNESRAPGEPPTLSVPVSKKAARTAVAALSGVHEYNRRLESAAKPAHDDDDDDLEEDDDEDDDFDDDDDDDDDVPVPDAVRAAAGAAAPKSNSKKTLRERAATLQRQCGLNYVAASGLALATIVNQDEKKMQDWAADEVVTQLRVLCIPCNKSWKVPASSAKKVFARTMTRRTVRKRRLGSQC
jgi:hypothetical protein